LFSLPYRSDVVFGVVWVVRDLLCRFREGLPPDHVLERLSWSQVVDELAVERFGHSSESRELDRFPHLGSLELAHPLLGDSHPQRQLEL
jgi:hypothetical protein